jgi:ankyrin repeat protein
MLEAGADIDSLDEHGQTALMNAVHWGNLEMAKLLVQHGAELDHTAKLRLTALYLAVIGNRPECVRLLVDARADTQIKGSTWQFDRTPLEYAQHYKYEAIVQILQQR